jgi:hypothetical protein
MIVRGHDKENVTKPLGAVNAIAFALQIQE